MKRIQVLEDCRIPAREARNWEDRKDKKRRITRKEHRRLWNDVEMGGFHGTERCMESRQRENVAGQRCIVKEIKETLSESTRPRMKRSS